MILVTWPQLKEFVTQHESEIQYLDLGDKYHVTTYDGLIIIYTEINKNPSDTTDLDDFEDNYKPTANKPLPKGAIGTLKMTRASCTTDASGDGQILLQIPGTAGTKGTRLIKGGIGWFETPHAGDYVKVYITDEDNILGYGSGTVIGSYTDTDMPAGNQGWYIPIHRPIISSEKISSENGKLMGGLYIKIVVKKGTNTVDTFRINLEWGV